GRYGFDAEAGIGRQFIGLASANGGGFVGEVGLAGLVVEQIDPGVGIIDHDDVVEAVAIQVRHVQLADLAINREDFRAGEAEAVGVSGGGQAVQGAAYPRSPNQN